MLFLLVSFAMLSAAFIDCICMYSIVLLQSQQQMS